MQDNLGFWIPSRGFRIPGIRFLCLWNLDSEFQSLVAFRIPCAVFQVPKSRGAIHSTKIPTGLTGKRGPPQKVDPFFRNFSGWTEPIHWVLDRISRKFGWMDHAPGFRILQAKISRIPEFLTCNWSWRNGGGAGGGWVPRGHVHCCERRPDLYNTKMRF